MPFNKSDKQCISKKRHIGNNFVTIVYDDSDNGYEFGTIKVRIRFALILLLLFSYKQPLE